MTLWKTVERNLGTPKRNNGGHQKSVNLAHLLDSFNMDVIKAAQTNERKRGKELVKFLLDAVC